MLFHDVKIVEEEKEEKKKKRSWKKEEYKKNKQNKKRKKIRRKLNMEISAKRRRLEITGRTKEKLKTRDIICKLIVFLAESLLRPHNNYIFKTSVVVKKQSNKLFL